MALVQKEGKCFLSKHTLLDTLVSNSDLGKHCCKKTCVCSCLALQSAIENLGPVKGA